MNIFYFDSDARECARQHCDKHVVKMIIESAQLLSTAHRVLDGAKVDGRWKHPTPSFDEFIYKASHVNHPSNKWTRQSSDQYLYLYRLFEALSDEYTHRYKKEHKTFKKLNRFLMAPPRSIWNVKGFIEPPQCMPVQYKSENTIESYRQYYIKEKLRFIRYTNRSAPDWIKPHLQG